MKYLAIIKNRKYEFGVGTSGADCAWEITNEDFKKLKDKGLKCYEQHELKKCELLRKVYPLDKSGTMLNGGYLGATQAVERGFTILAGNPFGPTPVFQVSAKTK